MKYFDKTLAIVMFLLGITMFIFFEVEIASHNYGVGDAIIKTICNLMTSGCVFAMGFIPWSFD